MRPVRVLIADDHPLFSKAVEALLARIPYLEVVGVARDGYEAIGLAVSLSADVVLMDVQMPNLDGFAATSRLRELRPGVATIVLTASDDPAYAERAVEAGAYACLTKDELVSALVPTVLGAAGARGRLSGDGGAELAGRARVG